MKTERNLADILNGTEENYILPFLWMHGESEEELIEEIDAVYRAGIRAVCLESRTHEDFASDGWWHDCDILLREAKKRGMKVWILDDKHFPTGYANGLVLEKYPQHRKWHLTESHVDVMGPNAGTLIIEANGADFEKRERSVFKVIACKRDEKDEVMTGEMIDITEHVHENVLYWDVPEGLYRIFMLYKTREGGRPGYINMIDEQSVDVLIEAVYEPHFAHYHEEFGKTFAGFFSDEPCFGNGFVDSFNVPMREQWPGVPYQAMPWREDLLERLSKALGEDAAPYLPALWYDCGEKTALMRYTYMDVVTALYRDCFNKRLGDWCRNRGVQYIGHVIEEQGLGGGAGHFFRSLSGQDMSGIDLIFQMIIPGMTGYKHTSWGTGHIADSDFLEYVLGKLGSSLAHIGEHTAGRAMCEIFGAGGWAEGMPMCKWLIDHMLVRGINHFVPHAFTPRFPDYDCPPHFYAKGNFAQFEDFGYLMRYTNRMCHLLSDGEHVASAVLLYDVDARWFDEQTMNVKEPAKALYDAHIDYDIIPCDSLLDGAKAESGKLVLQKESYPCLVMPRMAKLPKVVLRKISEFASAGLPVIVIDSFPKTLENETVDADVTFCSVDSLAETVTSLCVTEISTEPVFPYLRFYHYKRSGADYFMCFNESMQNFDGRVKLPVYENGVKLDLLNGTTEAAVQNGSGVALSLNPYESCVLAFGAMDVPAANGKPTLVGEQTLETFRISMCEAADYPNFEGIDQQNLCDITAPLMYRDFSGFIRYETDFAAESGKIYFIDLGAVGETAKISCNGKTVARRICPPYTAELTDAVTDGKNKLCIEVANSMGYRMKDVLSTQLMMQRSGLLGPVKVKAYKK